jgi:stage V sporulation protein S
MWPRNWPKPSNWRKNIMDVVKVNQPLVQEVQARKATPDVIRVAADSRTAAVAGAIAGIVRDHNYAEIQAIGASAVNQAVKAMTLAKDFLSQDGIHVSFVPEFVDVDINGQVRTSIKFNVTPR